MCDARVSGIVDQEDTGSYNIVLVTHKFSAQHQLALTTTTSSNVLYHGKVVCINSNAHGAIGVDRPAIHAFGIMRHRNIAVSIDSNEPGARSIRSQFRNRRGSCAC